MRYDLVAFDLDGTLVDSSGGIEQSANAALAQFGYSPLTPAQLTAFIGPSLRTSFATLASNPDHVDDLVDTYKAHYAAGHLHDAQIYDGIEDVLARLVARGVTLGVATAKTEVFAVEILERNGLARYFAAIAGADSTVARLSKAEVLGSLLDRLGVEASRSVLVGDRDHDVLGAAAHAMPCVAVTWGFGSESELLSAGATQVVHHPSEVLAFCSG